MSDAGAAQKRPALRAGPSLVLGVVAPRSHPPPRPDPKSEAPNCTGYVVMDPKLSLVLTLHGTIGWHHHKIIQVEWVYPYSLLMRLPPTSIP